MFNASVIKYRNLNLGDDFVMGIYSEMHDSLWTRGVPRDTAGFPYSSFIN